MPVKRIVPFIISLVILGLAVFGLLQAANHPRMRGIRTALRDKTAIFSDNLLDSVAPSRRRPFTTIELEENLKLRFPALFEKFEEEDWQYFWHLLYGRFSEGTAGWPERKRQLTKQEVQEELAKYYFRPFNAFSQQQWASFWKDTLKGEVF